MMLPLPCLMLRVLLEPDVALGPSASVTVTLGDPPFRVQLILTFVAVSRGTEELSSYTPKTTPVTLEKLHTVWL